MTRDKNLQNVVKDLAQEGATSHEAQQINRARSDRHKESTHGKEGTKRTNIPINEGPAGVIRLKNEQGRREQCRLPALFS